MKISLRGACETGNVTPRPRRLVTLDGYSVEGGFDGPGLPTTVFAAAVHLGQVAAPTPAVPLFQHFAEVLPFVQELGLDGISLTLEWARLEPRADDIDEAAYAVYADALRAAAAQGLFRSALLVRDAWPAWLGPEAWLMPWTRERVVRHAERVAERLGDLVDNLVVVADPEGLAHGGYVAGTRPPWRRRANEDARAAATSIAAIVDDVAALPAWRGRVCTSFREIPVVSPGTALSTALNSVKGVEQIHISSLVAGTGVAAGSRGLVVARGDGWYVDVSDDVRDALR